MNRDRTAQESRAESVQAPAQYRCAICQGIFDLDDDDDASEYSSTVPGFQPEQIVRVCDGCFEGFVEELEE